MIVAAGALDAAGSPPFGFPDPGADAAGLSRLDALLARPYDGAMDRLSGAFVAVAALAPAAATLLPSDDWFELGQGYVEAAAFAYGLKELGKSLVERYRPYAFLDAGARSGDGADRSFPSGHAAIAFAGATYAAVAVGPRFKDSRWRWPLTIGAYLAASAAAGLRVASGEHYLSDVLAGAACGALAGALAPLARSALGRVGPGLSRAGIRLRMNAATPGVELVIAY